jgi:CHAD domain-containing protein
MSAWIRERENERQALIAYIDSEEYDLFKQEFNRFVQTPGEGVREISEGAVQARLVCEIVPALIYTRMGAVRAYDRILQKASDTQLHALRIEFKKLRYAIEYFREVLGEEATQVIQDLKLMQDHLGDFHDAVVACGLVTTFLKDWENIQLEKRLVERQNPELIVSYLAHLHAERHKLLINLPEAWNYFNRTEFRSNLARAITIL